MIIPKTIKVGGRNIEVVTKNKILDGEGYAECKLNRVTIEKPAAKNCPEERKIIFLHEIIHIIEEVWDIHLSESKVTRLSEAFYQIIDQVECKNTKCKQKSN